MSNMATKLSLGNTQFILLTLKVELMESGPRTLVITNLSISMVKGILEQMKLFGKKLQKGPLKSKTLPSIKVAMEHNKQVSTIGIILTRFSS
jgi:hypothetical protein